MTAHSALSGSELHEPKGVAGASEGEVYVADGSGSGAWEDPLADVNNKNLIYVSAQIEDLSDNTKFAMIPAPRACKVVNVAVVCEANFTGSNNVLTAEVVSAGVGSGSGTATNLSLTLTQGSGVNAVFSGTVSSSNALTTSQALLIKTNGAGTGTSKGHIVVTLDVSS